MSDFIFSSVTVPETHLSSYIKSIYHKNKPDVTEYHGEWGSLAVSRNLHYGLQPLETDEYIFFITGGPVLCFANNDHLVKDDPIAGTRIIYERWCRNEMNWENDLSGPFVIFILDKKNKKVICVTDLMMFIPVYKYVNNSDLILGTHVDVTAKAIKTQQHNDIVSLVDFVLNGEITFPYTAYENIRQCHPATVYQFNLQRRSCIEKTITYWLPLEENPFNNIDEAALYLRNGMQDYVNRITNGMDRIAQFLSGGEDSRALAGLLPQELKRDSFIFLNCMNREGRIAQKAAAAYNTNFNVSYRDITYYLDILPEATDLIGNGHQYTHSHTIGFVDNCNLKSYSAVFGGFLSDALLKAGCSKTWWDKKFIFLPQFTIKSTENNYKNTIFNHDIINAIMERRRNLLNRIKSIRPSSAYDWFKFWPATMCDAISSFNSNRRLFRSYEPFFSNQVVKVSAAVPIKWKLNRYLFYKAMKPMLKKSKWLIHSDGRLPYYSWRINFFIGGMSWAKRYLIRRLKKTDILQDGPWGNLQDIISHPKWNDIVDFYNDTSEKFVKLTASKVQTCLLKAGELKTTQKINLLQVLYALKKHNDTIFSKHGVDKL